MNWLINFLSSDILANVLAIIGIVIALLPQKDKISIDNSITINKNYYFDSGNQASRSGSDLGKAIAIGTVAYITYAILRPYFPLILILTLLILIVRYRKLRIAYKREFILPLIYILLYLIVRNFAPIEVLDYWENIYQVNWTQMNNLHNIIEQILMPVTEFFTLLVDLLINRSPLTISLAANITLIVASSVTLFDKLIKATENNKHKIQIETLPSIVISIVVVVFVTSFVFYINPDSTARGIADWISQFLGFQ